jgi:branched-chain amino acid transport system substrate-binding protein
LIGRAKASGDTINAVKQAGELGIQQGAQKFVASLFFIDAGGGMGLRASVDEADPGSRT